MSISSTQDLSGICMMLKSKKHEICSVDMHQRIPNALAVFLLILNSSGRNTVKQGIIVNVTLIQYIVFIYVDLFVQIMFLVIQVSRRLGQRLDIHKLHLKEMFIFKYVIHFCPTNVKTSELL